MRNRTSRKKMLSYTLLILAVIIFITLSLSFANTTQDEITQLENELETAGYGWLSNYLFLIGDVKNE